MNSMTNDELREFISGLAVRNAELAELQRQTERQIQQTDRQLQQTDRQLQDTDLQVKETSRVVKELSQETNRQLRELKQQIGGLGEKFGSFTEGMAFPSMRKLLQQRFHMDVVTLRALARKNGHSL